MRRYLGALILLVFASAASADTNNDNFRLTMANIRATIASMKGLVQLLESDPQLSSRFRAEKAKLADTNGRDTLSMTAARLETLEPRVAAVYRKAGITPKEAGMTLETLIGVVMGDAMMEATKAKAELPKGFVADNMAFYKQNKTEIMQVFGELKGLKSSLDDDDEGKDEDEAEDDGK